MTLHGVSVRIEMQRRGKIERADIGEEGRGGNAEEKMRRVSIASVAARRSIYDAEGL